MLKSVVSVVLIVSAFTLQDSESDAKSVDPEFKQNQMVSGADKPIVVLRTLDKVTARIRELPIKVGETASFGTLEITVNYCRSTPPIETPETYAHLNIIERGLRKQQISQVFNGWMLKSSPALSSLEHSVYDVWVIACKTASGDAFTGSDNQLD